MCRFSHVCIRDSIACQTLLGGLTLRYDALSGLGLPKLRFCLWIITDVLASADSGENGLPPQPDNPTICLDPFKKIKLLRLIKLISFDIKHSWLMVNYVPLLEHHYLKREFPRVVQARESQ